ncbi:hypothetical protein DVH24_025987 [Malus domestica]|uniref:Uncharacterized protein n=1 Tax=Malus domestica TaxID=3750 RepID=A0A498KI56_MALDO|nr:hypothetical protein DVH24_025987 [Malus domestica]
MKKSCEGFRAYFGSCCENKLKSKEKAEAAICSFGKLVFFQSTRSYSAPLMKRPTIRLLFFPKALLQKSLPNALLIYFTAAYSHSTAAYSHNSFFSKHSNTKPALKIGFKPFGQFYKGNPKTGVATWDMRVCKRSKAWLWVVVDLFYQKKW